MRHCFSLEMLIVSKILKFLLLASCLYLNACQNNKEDEPLPSKNQPNLNRAATINMQLGLGYLKQGDRPRAKKKLLTALEQEPNSADVNAAMAYYLEQTSEIDEAKKYYLKAISLSSNSGAQLNNYGTFLCRQGDYKQAETYFLKAVKDTQYIHTAGAYENAGLCVLAIPNIEKAKLYFNKALNQDPSRRESFYELLKLESKEAHNERAFQLIQTHPDLVLNNKGLLELAKDLAYKTGKPEIAAEYENYLNKLKGSVGNSQVKLNVDNTSGVNNAYNSHNR